jgi:hypothetical protein
MLLLLGLCLLRWPWQRRPDPEPEPEPDPEPDPPSEDDDSHYSRGPLPEDAEAFDELIASLTRGDSDEESDT